MTTDIKDGVAWKPWWIRYAEFEGRKLRLADRDCSARPHRDWWHLRFDLAFIGNRPCPEGIDGCTHTAGVLFATNSLDEALAAFHDAEIKLLAGEL